MLTGIILLDIFLLLFILFVAYFTLFGKKEKKEKKPQIKYQYLNEKYRDHVFDVAKHMVEKESKTSKSKEEKSKKKIRSKDVKKATTKGGRVFILNFVGGVFAEQTEVLREEITSVLFQADPKKDEVVLLLDSPGGTVNGYGLGASQLKRIKDKGIKLTVIVDQMAASGGYMMACVADKIVAAPFAYIGSIGVVSEFPNYSGLFKKLGIEWKTYTAGNSKRDVGSYKKATPADEKRHRQKLEEIHQTFIKHVKEYRKKVDIKKTLTGETWTANEALKRHLVDEIQTSDEYILKLLAESNVYKVTTPSKKSKLDKILDSVADVAVSRVEKFLRKNRINT